MSKIIPDKDKDAKKKAVGECFSNFPHLWEKKNQRKVENINIEIYL